MGKNGKVNPPKVKQPKTKRQPKVEVYVDPDKARFISLFKRHHRTATNGG